MRESAAAVGGVALAVVCCAGAPLLIGALGGLTVAVALGWGALLVVAAIVATLFLSRRNRGSDRG